MTQIPVLTRDRILCHYTTLEKAIEYILPSKQLRINPIINTNDPRENKRLLFGAISSGGESLMGDEIIQMSESVSKVVREGCKVLCFSQDSEHLDGYQLSQMWALYGAKHEGISIGIDYDRFIMENRAYIQDGCFKPISYVSPKALKQTIITERFKNVYIPRYRDKSQSISYLKNDFRHENLDYLFFTKTIEWEHEQEFRLTYFSENRNDEFCSIKDCLSHVFLGIDFNMNYLPSVKQVINDDHCRIWKLDFEGEWLICREV